MEKEQQHQDSLATVAVKDYAPSESGFSCEPPPAYHKPMRSTAVQVARIAAVTLVLMSFILGSFILAGAWLQAARSCELQLQLQEDFSRQQEDQPGYQALVSDPLQPEESMPHKKLAVADQRLDAEPQQQEAEARDQQQDQGQEQDQEQDDSSDEQPSEEDGADREQQLHFKLPLTLDFDDLAGSLVERNLRARMDCVVEKRRLDQTVAQPARELRLPFGLNVSTAPRLEHSTGERLAISCETGRDQRHMPAMEVMGPVMVPLPGPVQLPLQFHGAHMQPQQQPQVPHRPRPHPHPQPQPQSEEQAVPLHILEALRIPIQVAELQQGPSEMQRIPIQITEVHEIPEMRQGPGRIPPQVVAEMRAAVQLAAAEAAAAAARRSPQPQPQRPMPMPMPEAQLRAHLEAQAQAQAQQAQQSQARRMPPHLQLAEAQQIPMHMFEAHQIPIQVAEGQVFEAHHVPMQMSEEAEARSAQEGGSVSLEAMQMPYQRLVPPPPQPQAHQGPARPHYVHPRSVRSVDQVFHKRDKRVRRCACDCAC